ncbi:DUF5615 family PIN-like protein [Nostoc sp. TCL240-02]|uniref:DUF5615 family PIN-like protein n=1 Tax=Nostoc sp. TCL240-02 TaxID=2572090 RepID=UPI00157F9518|nr:DUF5615 family PIN-like protein [Nostoc sp. TCL240-02]
MSIPSRLHQLLKTSINRVDFIRLHRRDSNHFGIIACTNNRNWGQFASRIDEAVTAEQALQGKLIRVVQSSHLKRF